VIPVQTKIPGILRGIIRDGFPVSKGFKLADVDPRLEEKKNCFTISDKARCIAGSVLELCVRGLSDRPLNPLRPE
jgi:xanthine dehydrogenase accessory factor